MNIWKRLTHAESLKLHILDFIACPFLGYFFLKTMKAPHEISVLITQVLLTFSASILLISKEGLTGKELWVSLSFPLFPCHHIQVSGWLIQGRNMNERILKGSLIIHVS